jgi:hypothetical protein
MKARLLLLRPTIIRIFPIYCSSGTLYYPVEPRRGGQVIYEVHSVSLTRGPTDRTGAPTRVITSSGLTRDSVLAGRIAIQRVTYAHARSFVTVDRKIPESVDCLLAVRTADIARWDVQVS